MNSKVENAKKLDLPDLTDAIDLYEREARFCQLTPEDSHLSVIFKLRETFGDTCDYMEIGCLFGFSMVNATRSKTKGKFVGVDLFENTGKIDINDYTPDIKERNLCKEKTESLVERCNINNHKINFIQGNSQDDSTLKKVLSISEEYDIMFIDGDHSFQGTYGDFKKYSPYLKSGGYLLFDDQDYTGIKRVIEIIKNDYKDQYTWVDWKGYKPKFSGFFIKNV
jgi:cephalosporin hydroxylase